MRKKELQASNLAETNASVIEAYEKYLRDKDADEKIARDQYFSVLLETLEGFIRHEIWERSKGQTYRLNSSDKEDLYQAGAMAIFQDMLRYDPYGSKAIVLRRPYPRCYQT
jgi:DNA-directed RNA polymerase specialized sigma subunit